MNEAIINELGERRDNLVKEIKKKEEEIIKREKETNRNRLFIIIVTLIIGFVISYTIIMSMTDPGPPYVSPEEQRIVLEKLIGTTWNLDDACKDERLEELSLKQINQLYFIEQDIDNDSILVELIYDRGKYIGKVITSKDGLNLLFGEKRMAIWYSESLDKRTKGVSIKGIRNKIFFIP